MGHCGSVDQQQQQQQEGDNYIAQVKRNADAKYQQTVQGLVVLLKESIDVAAKKGYHKFILYISNTRLIFRPKTVNANGPANWIKCSVEQMNFLLGNNGQVQKDISLALTVHPGIKVSFYNQLDEICFGKCCGCQINAKSTDLFLQLEVSIAAAPFENATM